MGRSDGGEFFQPSSMRHSLKRPCRSMGWRFQLTRLEDWALFPPPCGEGEGWGSKSRGAALGETNEGATALSDRVSHGHATPTLNPSPQGGGKGASRTRGVTPARGRAECEPNSSDAPSPRQI